MSDSGPTIIACYKIVDHKSRDAIVAKLKQHCWKAYLHYDYHGHFIYFDERHKTESFLAYENATRESLYDDFGPLEHNCTFSGISAAFAVESCMLHSVLRRWRHFWQFIIQIAQ